MSDVKRCYLCGAEVKDSPEARAEHFSIHNPTPVQWAEAYERIQAGKRRAKHSGDSAKGAE